MSTSNEEYLRQMYDTQLQNQKRQLAEDYESNLSNLDYEQDQAQKQTQKNINLTKVENQRTAANNAEYYAAAGLSSGAKAQARFAQDNQTQADISAFRAAQQEADAQAERQRSLLAKEYASAIEKAQADNDMALAEALYKDAKEQDEKLLQEQQEQAEKDLYAAQLMAQYGDYSRLATIYGLTEEEVAKLYEAYKKNNSSGSTGGAGGTTGTSSSNYDNGKVDEETVKKLQLFFGADPDGKWGANSTAAAGGMTAEQALAYFKTFTPDTIAAEVAKMKDQSADRKMILDYLNRAIDLGIVTSAQAAQIFNNRYKSAAN